MENGKNNIFKNEPKHELMCVSRVKSRVESISGIVSSFAGRYFAQNGAF